VIILTAGYAPSVFPYRVPYWEPFFSPLVGWWKAHLPGIRKGMALHAGDVLEAIAVTEKWHAITAVEVGHGQPEGEGDRSAWSLDFIGDDKRLQYDAASFVTAITRRAL
jgi:hypothetical protein